MTRMSAPSSDFARLRPLYAASLKERSLSPPMSVTSPILTFLAPESPLEPLLDDDEDDEPPLSSLPQAVSPTHSASSTATTARTPFPFTFPTPLTTALNPLPEAPHSRGRPGWYGPSIRRRSAVFTGSGRNAARTAVAVRPSSAWSSRPHSRAAT